MQLLTALRAAADPTRLRLLALCARSELTVSELVRILGQSQPRVSRHLKLLTDAGLLDRVREGSWVFHRLVGDGPGAEIASQLVRLFPDDDEELARDRHHLDEITGERERQAADYFRRMAPAWDQLRSLHIGETAVEAALLRLMGDAPVGRLLDIGTGTGRMLEVFAPRALRAQGLDQSSEMLAVARANLKKAGLNNCTVRKGDMYQLPFQAGSFDTVTIHQVLHFADNPGRAVAEAARVLAPQGRLLIADFAPHDREELRRDHEHRRLGFADHEVTAWFRAFDLVPGEIIHLPGAPITVTLWSAAAPASSYPKEHLSLVR